MRVQHENAIAGEAGVPLAEPKDFAETAGRGVGALIDGAKILEIDNPGNTPNCAVLDCSGLAIAPGFIDTDMTRALHEEQRSALTGRIPLGRLGQPADIAAAVVFLASPGGDYITGETLHVNGGMYMA